MFTTKEAAEYLGVSMARIRQLIGEGRLVAQRNGKSWLVDRESLDRFAATASVGRPRGSTEKRRSNAPVRYTLMSRGHRVARCVYDPVEMRFTQVDVIDAERVPLALLSYKMQDSLPRSFNAWWRGRGIPNSRWRLDRRLEELELRSAFELPLRSYGLSLSDQYWLLHDGDDVSWEDVNFFRNEYAMGPVGEDGSVASWAGAWMNAVGLSSPDNTTDGMLNKRWLVDEEGRRVLAKGCGSSGREAYNEVVATMLYRRLLPEGRYVEYRLGSWRGEDVSVCETFLREEEEFVPARFVLMLKKKPNSHSELRHYSELCEDLGVRYAESQLTRMLVCDSILANTDRHWGNFGVIRNIETLEYRWAPIFDTGTSLWSHLRPREIIGGDYSFETKPFYKDPGRQLEAMVDASWYCPEALEGFPDEVEGFLASALGSHALAAAIAKGVGKRIGAVNSWARQAATSRIDRGWIDDPEHIEWVWL